MTPLPTCPCLRCRENLSHPDGAHHRQLLAVLAHLDEHERRWVAALEAVRLGYGGTRAVAQITGLDEKTIRRGRRELASGLSGLGTGRVRRPGAGRPRSEKSARVALHA
jgi:hypothetical protein